ncbi:hypothetical protein ALC53_06153 [Atta colombica]|uniref:Uncharacterized protein n=1 Tax=Atta colombica TaxID=520822 RepID=A0A195BGS5_9HYME|nr:hypothetical protein ALC53_06153 [Atta colombica]
MPERQQSLLNAVSLVRCSYASEKFFISCKCLEVGGAVVIPPAKIDLPRCLLRSLSKYDSRSEINSRIPCLYIASL